MGVNVSTVQSTSRLAVACRDIVDGVRNYPIWTVLGWQDIRQRYRRSALGPFWITLTTLVTIAGMGPLYGALLKQDVRDFVPYLALGIIGWSLISTLILEGCTSFTSSDNMIRSVRLPLSVHILRVIYRNIIIFLHNILAYVPVMIYAGLFPKPFWLLAVPGIFIIVLAAFPAGLILSIFCARFRDMQPIVASVVQLAFFLTPILWKPTALGARAYIAHYNPLYIFLELVRGPIYGNVPGLSIYAAAGFFTLVLYAIAIPLFVRYRPRVAFWI